jgi:hypothetical protein
LERRVNGTHHAVDLDEHLVIPEPQYAVSARLQISCSLCIRRDLAIFAMSASINLDDEPMLMTCEVGEVSSDRGLATKVSLFQRQPTQMPPQLPLRIGHLPTQGARTHHAMIRLPR